MGLVLSVLLLLLLLLLLFPSWLLPQIVMTPQSYYLPFIQKLQTIWLICHC
jgi:hypothetical protein